MQDEILFRGTEPVALSQRAVALLRMLVEHAGAPVSKDALTEAAWPGLAVEESNLTVQISALRRALGELGPSGSARGAVSNHRPYRDRMQRSKCRTRVAGLQPIGVSSTYR